MESKTRALVLLEKLQRNSYNRVGKSADSSKKLLSDSAERERIVDKLLQATIGATDSPEETNRLRMLLDERLNADGLQELPTIYEDPLTYRITTELSAEIEKSATELMYQLPAHPVFGTLPTGKVNAVAIGLKESNEYLIIFNSGLFMFALLFCKCIAQAIPFAEVKGEQSITFGAGRECCVHKIRQDPEIISRFQQVLLAYLIEGDPREAPQYFLEGPSTFILSTLLSSLELFAMGHEYGHIIGKHLDPPESVNTGKEEEEQVMRRNWRQEVEADVLGLILMAHAMGRRGFDLSLGYLGADLFFSCIDIVERGVSFMRTGKEDMYLLSGSHPPASKRREILRNIISSDKQFLPAQNALGVAKILEEIVEMLWEDTKPLLERYRAKGVRLSPLWLTDES